ncbi:MAG: glycosyltransferase family 2 protein [Gammaproteobacteria bacterium]|nr:glycosyltransferase family 2 protein [Gammaproteobacteria bacterium]
MLMGKPIVAVVIPAFNAQAWIGETLQSVLALDYPVDSLELIVVDDGSSDDTANIVHTTMQSTAWRWQLVPSSGKGPSAARNTGWKLSQAEWIQFLDADDLLASSKLKVQLADDATKDDSVAVIYSAWQPWLQGTDGKWAGASWQCIPSVASHPVEELMSDGNFIATGSQVFRRGWLERVGGFDQARSLIEDVHLALRLAIAGGRFVRVESSTPLFFYRQVEGSQSRRDVLGFFKGVRDNTVMVQAHWEAQAGGVTAAQRMLLLTQYALVMRACRLMDVNLFDKTLQRARALQPRWLPRDRRRVVWLSHMVGYRAAEGFALRWIALRRRMIGR